MTTSVRTSTTETDKQAGAKLPPARELPPEWALERLVKKIGRGPAAAARVLDRAAKVPVLGWIVRRLSSVWLGIILLTLIGGYIAIGSGFPNLRAAFEMTDLQFFDAWPMRVLLALLAADLIIVTLRRIPLTLFKLGSWTVHVGILTLITGSVWYFSMKQEGSARMYLNRPVTAWYDVTERALYAFPMNADGTFDIDHPTITPIPNMPIYDEHIEEGDHHNPLDIPLPTAIPGTAGVRVAGYYPFADLRPSAYRAAVPGEPFVGPVVAVTLSTERDSMDDMWLRSDVPSERIFEMKQPLVVEFLNQVSPERLRDLQTSFDGNFAITVRIPKLKIERTYSLKTEEPIAVEGSPYTITPVDFGTIPMKSKGYEGTQSSELMVSVSRKDADKTFDFQRMCLSRYPERSPDFVMENGKQARKQDGVDHDIEIVFHDATRTQAWIVESAEGNLSVIVRTPDGKSVTSAADKAVTVPVEGMTGLKLAVTRQFDKAAAILSPRIIPNEQRPRGQTVMELLQYSVANLDVLLPGNVKVSNVYVPFVPYAEVNGPDGGVPTVVNIPGKGPVGLLLSTTKRQLPVPVTLVDFKPVKFPGAVRSYMDYVSTLQFGGTAGSGPTQVSHLNRPVYDQGLIYFQSQWDGDPDATPEKRFSVMGVANRPGLRVMIAGAILIAMGIGYAFYIKPLLMKYKKESLVAWNAARAQG